MFGLEDFQKDLAKSQSKLQRSISKNQSDLQKSISKNQKDLQKSWAKDLKLSIAKEGRVLVKADLRKKVYEKYKDKCHYQGCIIKDKLEGKGGKVLQIHHIDMNNKHTYLSNLELLCPTHHKMRHNEKMVKVTTTGNVIMGFKTKKKIDNKGKK